MTQQVRPEHGALFDLSARTKLRVTGGDRLRFLNGQISNDVRKASATMAIQACVLNAKGKMNGDIFIRADEDSFLIDAAPELREQLPARFERYMIADDVQLADVTNDFALLHTLGSSPPAGEGHGAVARATRFGCAGFDWWLPRANYEAALHELSATVPFCDDDAAETFRIERGVPRWGRELSDEIIPTEANLESSAIDYAKGCYIGQEVISRIKMSGQTNKRLCGLVAMTDAALANGMRLSDAGKDVGRITSTVYSSRFGKQIALGFVKRGSNGLGARLGASAADAAIGAEDVPVEIVALPFC